MKIKYRILFLTILLLLMVGCSYDNSSKDNTLKSKVIIKSWYEEPKSLKDKKTIIINGVSEGEFVEFIVEGEIKDFEHIKVEWDENQAKLIEKETLRSFDNLINQTIVIKTYIPEGIPSEKVKWKSSLGKAYEYTIQEHSLNDESNKNGIVLYLD